MLQVPQAFRPFAGLLVRYVAVRPERTADGDPQAGAARSCQQRLRRQQGRLFDAYFQDVKTNVPGVAEKAHVAVSEGGSSGRSC